MFKFARFEATSMPARFQHDEEIFESLIGDELTNMVYHAKKLSC